MAEGRWWDRDDSDDDNLDDWAQAGPRYEPTVQPDEERRPALMHRISAPRHSAQSDSVDASARMDVLRGISAEVLAQAHGHSHGTGAVHLGSDTAPSDGRRGLRKLVPVGRWRDQDAANRRSILVVVSLVIPVIALTIIGLIALWPAASAMPGKQPILDPNAVWVGATVSGAPDVETSTVPATITSIGDDAIEQLKSQGYTAPHKGDKITINVASEQIQAGMRVGSKLRVIYMPYAVAATTDGTTTPAAPADGADASQSPYIFVDYDRTMPIGVLAIAYGLLVVVVARWRGLAAFVGLGLSILVLGMFTLPALLTGQPPLLIALVSATAIMLVSLYVAHGVSIRTSTALLGTVAGLILTTGVGWWAAQESQLTGLTSEEALSLPSYMPGIDLRGIAMCGIVLAGLGVLNDVTVTQASSVWELRSLAPHARRTDLFRGAMRIGKDHIASTVYTIVFAYLGASLPLFMLLLLQEQSLGISLTSGSIAEEVVRTLVSSIGLVLAIPITTAIAAAMVPRARRTAAVQEPVGPEPLPVVSGSSPVLGPPSASA